jgi:hypothetical protein
MRDELGKTTKVIAGTMTETDADALAFVEGLLSETESFVSVKSSSPFAN